ncbi:putative lipoyltransferase 2, mitochondrial [Anneissia japonica]|uniref:putative lipoyltransferase 2, mitochondrial n=1 Tax=Anneissia japonica TaxID=1529436 RepID=UPI001425895D|nr:putative lipoyltransferase 2, mitochondrial [Anneissia japonica]XP_033121158.1 putative lipoyltransferase 2, mitochondrial [Anneissia japonica]
MTASHPLVRVCNLGRVSYTTALSIQKSIQTNIKNSLDNKKSYKACSNTLILCEHNPVYTIGIRTKDYPKQEEERLKKLGAEFLQTDRGGLITFHGPGQLVAYPILYLGDFKKSVRWYVCQLEKCIIETCRRFSIQGETSPHTGVWVNDNKIAAIGVQCKRFVTCHGLALNCNTDLSWFSNIIPCGIEGKGVTSLTAELGKEIRVDDAIPSFVDAFSQQFQCDVEGVDVKELKKDVNLR